MGRPESFELIPLLISSERVREMQLRVLQGFIKVNAMNRIERPIGEKEGLFLIDRGGKFLVEHQVIGSNEKKIVSSIVDTEEDARMLWSRYLLKFKK